MSGTVEHLSLQQKLANYYRNQGNSEWADRQDRSNMEVESSHPVATLDYTASDGHTQRKMEVRFFYKPNGLVSALLYALFEGVIKRRLVASFSEDRIIHAGWFSNRKVADMNLMEKSDFVAKVSRMYVYNIDDTSIYVCTKLFW